MPKCDFNKVAKQLNEIPLRHGCSPVNLLHIFRTPFPKNTSGWLLLYLLPITHSNLHFNIPKFFNSLFKFSKTFETSLSDYNELIWTTMKSLGFKGPTPVPPPPSSLNNNKRKINRCYRKHFKSGFGKSKWQYKQRKDIKKTIKI